MSSDRNRLLVKGGPKAGDPLPWDEWAVEFADRLPQPIIDAITQARSGESETDFDEQWRDRLAQRFAKRWRQMRLFADPSGDRTTESADDGTSGRADGHSRRAPKRRAAANKDRPTKKSSRSARVGRGEGGPDRARQRKTGVTLPKHEWKPGSDFDPGMFAIWNAPSAANPDGLIQLNLEHPVFVEEIRHWTPQYPTHLEDDVIKVLKDAYAQLAVACVAHSEALRPHLDRSEKLEALRSPEALTAALLGLVGPAALIGPMLGGALGRRRREPD